MCNAEGMEIQAASSGQEFGKKLAEQLKLKAEMDAKLRELYPIEGGATEGFEFNGYRMGKHIECEYIMRIQELRQVRMLLMAGYLGFRGERNIMIIQLMNFNQRDLQILRVHFLMRVL